MSNSNYITILLSNNFFSKRLLKGNLEKEIESVISITRKMIPSDFLYGDYYERKNELKIPSMIDGQLLDFLSNKNVCDNILKKIIVFSNILDVEDNNITILTEKALSLYLPSLAKARGLIINIVNNLFWLKDDELHSGISEVHLEFLSRVESLGNISYFEDRWDLLLWDESEDKWDQYIYTMLGDSVDYLFNIFNLFSSFYQPIDFLHTWKKNVTKEDMLNLNSFILEEVKQRKESSDVLQKVELILFSI